MTQTPKLRQRGLRPGFADLITTWPRATLSIVVFRIMISGLWGLGLLSRFEDTDPRSESTVGDELVESHAGRRSALSDIAAGRRIRDELSLGTTNEGMRTDVDN